MELDRTATTHLFKASCRVVSPADGELVGFAGVRDFAWSAADYPSLETLESLRTEGDELADDALAALLRLHQSLATDGESKPAATGFVPSNLMAFFTRAVAVLDATAVPDAALDAVRVRDAPVLPVAGMSASDRAAVLALWRSVTEVPDWVDWARVKHGQTLFWKYLIVNSATLGLYSLLGGYAADSVNQVLASTGYLASRRKNAVMRRLTETAHMLVGALQSVESIAPFGEGWVGVLNVRFLHALVRHRLRGSTKYDAALYGTAINQPDTLATGLSFSTTLLDGLDKFGLAATDATLKADYLHAWGYIVRLLGVKDEYNVLAPASAAATHPRVPGSLAPPPPGVDPVEHAHRASRAIGLHLFHPSDLSRTFAGALIEGLADQPPAYRSLKTMYAGARIFLGPQLAAALGVPDVARWRIALYRFRLSLVTSIFAWLWDYSPGMRAVLMRKYVEGHNELMAKFVFGLEPPNGKKKPDLTDPSLVEALREFAFAMRWDPARTDEGVSLSDTEDGDAAAKDGSRAEARWMWRAAVMVAVVAVSLVVAAQVV
ncbi:hypothetical protein H9P43_003689 [Blastocladiella emersonii ATCC 22665]|nr:hypothetical protein H9P43_003689 [Blastocladiella emersonii ATCC 22665]